MDMDFQWAHSNMDLVFLVYGAAFFLLGITILAQPKRGSSFQLANILWLLAVFGLVHGANEWLDMWKISHGTNLPIKFLGLFCLLLSYGFLFEFGRRLMLLTGTKSPLWQQQLTGYLGWKVYGLLIGGILLAGLFNENPWLALNIWSRYLLGFTGALLTGIGFLLYYRNEEERLTTLRIKPYFIWAALAFVIYGIASGLVVPAAGYFPASRFNYDEFLATTHLPVQVFRAAAAVLAAFAVTKILKMFRWEADYRLENALKQTQNALTEIEQLSRRNTLILAASGNGILGVDIQGTCSFANPAALKILGYEEQQLIGHSILVAVLNVDGSEISCNSNAPLILDIVREGRAQQMDETIFRRSDGSTFAVEYQVMPIKEKGTSVGAVITFQDITERKQAEKKNVQLQQQLQQAQKMEALGQLTGGIAHDFNNMLASILGYTELAREQSKQYANAQMEKYLGQIYNSGTRARDLIANMLAFSRDSNIEAQALLLQPLIKETVKMMASTLPSNIMLHTQIDDGVPMVMLDPVQLHQILMNLCINARDAIQGNGDIDIQLHRLSHVNQVCGSCHEQVQGEFVELVVRDTGSGIKPEVINRMFNPFYTTKEVGKGTGMGLPMVHGIVHEHSGHILIDTVHGEGSTFHLLFPPVNDAAQVDDSEEDKEPIETAVPLVAGSGVGHILVVDDEVSVASFETKLLQHQGYQVTMMTDSREALALFKENPKLFDLVLTDQMMPGMTGTELAQSVLAIRPELPVILCTGCFDPTDEAKAISLGIKAYVSKPIETDELFSLIENQLRLK